MPVWPMQSEGDPHRQSPERHLPHIGLRKIKSVLALLVGFLIWQLLRLILPGLDAHPIFIYIYGMIEIRETSDKTTAYGKMRVIATFVAIAVGLPMMLLTDWLQPMLIVSWMKTALSSLSGTALGLVSEIATGIPSFMISLLTMIFSTVFVVSDYERLADFTRENIPEKIKHILSKVRLYLTDTLFVVIRSYVMIMLLTFTELSILFSLFGIEHAVLKAAGIAIFDIMPILGAGGIVIPWAVVSLVLGYTNLGIKLLIIYVIITVIRNYVEPKIVGTQLGLHPIITLVTMFIGLRLFGFWAMFGLPVGISFLWKEKAKKESATA